MFLFLVFNTFELQISCTALLGITIIYIYVQCFCIPGISYYFINYILQSVKLSNDIVVFNSNCIVFNRL